GLRGRRVGVERVADRGVLGEGLVVVVAGQLHRGECGGAVVGDQVGQVGRPVAVDRADRVGVGGRGVVEQLLDRLGDGRIVDGGAVGRGEHHDHVGAVVTAVDLVRHHRGAGGGRAGSGGGRLA